jgi:hypothetical protein
VSLAGLVFIYRRNTTTKLFELVQNVSLVGGRAADYFG